MSDARQCDGPGCSKVTGPPYVGWWQLHPSTLVAVGRLDRADFCSWECLGAFVFEQAGQLVVPDEERQPDT